MELAGGPDRAGAPVKNPRTEPCVGPGCREHVDPGEHFCVCCRLALELAGHEAQLLSLDFAVDRDDEDSVVELRGQMIGALAAQQRRRT